MKTASLCLALLLSAALTSLWSGCAAPTEAQKQTLNTQAAFDLDCDKLTISETGPNTFGVEGCGKRASYLCEAAYAPPTCIMSKLLSKPGDTLPEDSKPEEAPAEAPTMNTSP